MGNGNKALVEVIGLFRLQLEFGCYLDLDKTLYVLSFRWNLVSVSCLDKSDYSYSFGNGKMTIFQYSNMISISSLVGNLYKLDIYVSHIYESLHASNCGTNRKLTDENSSMLWHKRLGYISKQRIQRLMSEGILDSLNFSDLKICIECIKGKQTNVRKIGANRSSSVLELIHTDICGPFPMTSWNGQ